MGEYKWAHAAQFAPVTPEQLEKKQSNHNARVYVKDVMTKRMDMILDGKANVIYLDVDLEYMDYRPYDPYFAGVYEPGIPVLHGRKRKLRLPTPFQPGEMITMDMRPFFPVRHAVMLGAMDKESRRPDSLPDEWCVYIGEDDRVYAGNVNDMKYKYLSPDSKGRDYYSKPFRAEFNPLLRAVHFSGELPRHELLLKRIADGVQNIPGLAAKINAAFNRVFVGNPHDSMEKDKFRQMFAELYT